MAQLPLDCDAAKKGRARTAEMAEEQQESSQGEMEGETSSLLHLIPGHSTDTSPRNTSPSPGEALPGAPRLHGGLLSPQRRGRAARGRS